MFRFRSMGRVARLSHSDTDGMFDRHIRGQQDRSLHCSQTLLQSGSSSQGTFFWEIIYRFFVVNWWSLNKIFFLLFTISVFKIVIIILFDFWYSTTCINSQVLEDRTPPPPPEYRNPGLSRLIFHKLSFYNIFVI